MLPHFGEHTTDCTLVLRKSCAASRGVGTAKLRMSICSLLLEVLFMGAGQD